MLSFLGGCAQLIPAISSANPPVCLALGIVSLLSMQNWKVSPHFSINSGVLRTPAFGDKINNGSGLKRGEKMLSWSCLYSSH